MHISSAWWWRGSLLVVLAGLLAFGWCAPGVPDDEGEAVLATEAGRWMAVLSRLKWFPGGADPRGRPQDLPEETVAYDPDEGAWYVTVDDQPGVPPGWSGLLVWKERAFSGPEKPGLGRRMSPYRKVWWIFRGNPARSGCDAPLEFEGWIGHGPKGCRVVFAATDPGRGSWEPPHWEQRFTPSHSSPSSNAKKFHGYPRSARSGGPGWTAGKRRCEERFLQEG